MSSEVQIESTLLADRRGVDGGWGASSGLPSDLESTAMALMTLDRADPAWEAGRAWLSQRRQPTGAWSHSDAVSAASWATPLVALALSRSPSDREAVASAAAWIVERKGRLYPWYTRAFFWLFPDLNPIEMDSGLVGWPWSENTFSWVEPTAYAMIALRRLRPLLSGELATAADQRLAEGERLILDRACPGGGWNYGNGRVLDEDLWPYPDTTALALLAIRGSDDARVDTGLAALQRLLRTHDSTLALALSALAFRAYGRESSPIQTRLRSRLEESPPADTRSLALALQAVSGRSPLIVGGAG